MYALNTLRLGLIPAQDIDTLELLDAFETVEAPTPEQVAELEVEHGHEIVAFLHAYLGSMPEAHRPFYHYGLTSSDLTEFDLHVSVRDHSVAMDHLLFDLLNELHIKVDEYAGVQRAGRTHGQTAELTTLENQLNYFKTQAQAIRLDLQKIYRATPLKYPGPTGVSTDQQPLKQALGFEVVPSTQIVPRYYLHRWANTYLQVANLLDSMAVFVRLGARSEIGEFREGAADSRHGSSAMPGKKNPIQSERISGLARVARGHHSALTNVAGLWEDRDLSNSSTERVSVPGIAQTVEYMVLQMTEVVRDLQIDIERISANADDPRTRANKRQNQLQRENRISVLDASDLATKGEDSQ